MAKKGYTVTEAVVKRLEKARSFHKNFEQTEETKQKIALVKLANKGKPTKGKGKKLSEEHKNKLKSLALKRVNEGTHNWWKGGVTDTNALIRVSAEYKEWRKEVFKRDNYTCVDCGVKGNGKNLQADHIKPFSLFPELRFDITNGRTLCVDCHKKTDTFGWKQRHANKEQKLI